MSELRGELIASATEAEEIAGDWRGLAEARGNAFITPEWVLGWIRRLGGTAWDPAIGVARRPDGRVAGVLPLVARRGGRELRSCPLGDRFQPACEPADELAVARAIAPALREGSARRVRLANVDVESPWWRALADGSGLAAVEGPEASLPWIDLSGLDWEGYLASRSRQFRSQIRGRMRKLERAHEVRSRRASTRAEVERDLGTLFRLHDARWDSRAGVSSFAGEELRGFHREFAAAAHDRGWLRLHVIEADGEPVAALYGWLVGGSWAYYQAGFDSSYSKASPGLLVITETIRAATEEGAREYDLLLGGESYKSRLTDRARMVRDVELVGRVGPARVVALGRNAARRRWRELPAERRERIRELLDRLSPGRGG